MLVNRLNAIVTYNENSLRMALLSIYSFRKFNNYEIFKLDILETFCL